MKVPTLLIAIYACLLAPISWAQDINALDAIEGLWRIEYRDSRRGVVSGQAAIKAGKIDGFFVAANGDLDVFRADRFKFGSSRLEGNFYPYFLGVEVDLRLVGANRLIGQWKSRGNNKEPSLRDGARTYENPKDPYWYQATGTTTWTRMIPDIRRIDVTTVSKEPLDYPKMKANWEAALVNDNLPTIAVDFYGEDLPTNYQAKYFELENNNPTLRFRSMTGFPDEGRLRVIFHLLKGTTPGAKLMRLNGRSVVVPLVFSNYIEEEGEYLVTDVFLDREVEERMRRELSEDIELLKGQIEDGTELLKKRNSERRAVEAKFVALDKKVKEVAAVLGPLLVQTDDPKSTEPSDQETRSALVKRNYHQTRLAAINDEISSISEKARVARESSEQEATDLLKGIPALRTEAATHEADLAEVEARLAPYLKSRAESERALTARLTETQLQYFDLDRRRDLILEELKTAAGKVQDQGLLLEGLSQSLNEALSRRGSQGHAGAAVVEGLRVANAETNETLYYSFRRPDTEKDKFDLDELIAESEAAVMASRGAYVSWRNEFEDNFDEARYRLGIIGGPTGKIMQSAAIQAASETAVYLHDLLDDYRDGNLPLVIGDLFVKAIQASRGKILTINNLDDEQLRVLRGVFESKFASDPERISLDELLSLGADRWDTEKLNFLLKKTINKAIVDAARSGEQSVFRALCAGASRNIKDTIKASKGMLGRATFRATLSSTGVPIIKSVLKSYVKDVANAKIKNYAETIEKKAYIEYFLADILANESYKYMCVLRERYWQAQDFHNELLRTRAQLNEDLESLDRETELQQETQLKFTAGTKLRIKVLYAGSNSQRFADDVYLNGVLTTPSEDGNHFATASFLTPNDKGSVTVTVRSRPRSH